MGIQKELIKEGTGPIPQRGQMVTVHCTGMGKNRDLNVKFWSTKDPGQEPFTFQVGMGQVIKGWDEGVLGMKVGERAKLTCTPDYAYGPGGFPAWGIMPDSTLCFDIEVLSAK
mmetsp:Transcript_2800/g.5555  ORF Transcript_2800/g.5555 Transcript_2800/m.5555 type:complete len:113 (-) Transcript_2800:588-926(-)|eukprot:CAMPEP_0114228948 /NCGR_PEP_ID=MMETSP0058-20121206/2633_1 /TAXON_ID=36894 /ORGANISM="Pyramimonas parkeae, CCMP726" /LENGTH=112 /DNA_ID=CAMNT_0001339965 /DNA_START=89 /DNA_END=427 /DNA_ORIENTATION=-